MKRVALLLFFPFFLFSQQELGTYFFSELYQSSSLNPSFDPKENLVIALPSIYGVFHQRGIAVTNALQGSILDLSTDRRRQIMAGASVSLIDVSYRRNKIRYSLTHGYNQFVDFQFGTPLLTLVSQGNSYLIGGAASFSPHFELISYSETSIGLAYTGVLSFGGKVKLLNGIHNLHTARSSFDLSVNDDVYQLDVQADALINSSFPINLQDFSLPQIVRLGFVPRNFGVAFDLGLDYKNGPIRLSASVLDMGILNWNEQVHNYDLKGNIQYEGATFEEIVNQDFNLLDTLSTSFNLTDAEQSYQHFVPIKYYLSASYEVNSGVNVGALFYHHRNVNRGNSAFVVNLQKHWNHKHALAIQYGIIGPSPINLGLSAYTTLGPVQLFGICDNVLGLRNPTSAANTNVRMGLNLVFDTSKNENTVQYALN